VKELRGAYAFVERNINPIKRYWGWEVVWSDTLNAPVA